MNTQEVKTMKLSRTDLVKTAVVLETEALEKRLSDTKQLVEDRRDALSTGERQGDGRIWHQQRLKLRLLAHRDQRLGSRQIFSNGR